MHGNQVAVVAINPRICLWGLSLAVRLRGHVTAGGVDASHVLITNTQKERRKEPILWISRVQPYFTPSIQRFTSSVITKDSTPTPTPMPIISVNSSP